MRRPRRFVPILLVFLALSSAFVAPAIAQTDDGSDGDLPIDVPDEYANGDDEDADSDDGESGDGDADDSDSGDGDGDGDADDDAGATEQIGAGDGVGATVDSATPSAGELLEGIAEWLEEAVLNVVEWIIDGTLGIATGTPTPENAGWMGIFGSPTNEPFAALYTDLHDAWVLPLTLSFLAVSLFLAGAAMPFSGFIGKFQTSRWIALFFVTLIAVALGWPIVTMMHMISDAIGTAIAPSSDELLGSGQGLQTLVTGALPAAGGLYIFTWAKVVTYALIYGMRYFFLLTIMPYVFPFALAVAIAAPWRKLRALGSGILWFHVGLLIVNIPAAILWRVAYIIEWDFGLSGLAGLLMVMGALLAAVVIPIVIMWQLTRMTGVVSGAVGGAATNLRHRDDYTPKTYKHAKAGVARSRDIGSRGLSRAHTASQSIRQRETIHESWGDSRSNTGGLSGGVPGISSARSSSGGGTQADRRRRINPGTRTHLKPANSQPRPHRGD